MYVKCKRSKDSLTLLKVFSVSPTSNEVISPRDICARGVCSWGRRYLSGCLCPGSTCSGGGAFVSPSVHVYISVSAEERRGNVFLYILGKETEMQMSPTSLLMIKNRVGPGFDLSGVGGLTPPLVEDDPHTGD